MPDYDELGIGDDVDEEDEVHELNFSGKRVDGKIGIEMGSNKKTKASQKRALWICL